MKKVVKKNLRSEQTSSINKIITRSSSRVSPIVVDTVGKVKKLPLSASNSKQNPLKQVKENENNLIQTPNPKFLEKKKSKPQAEVPLLSLESKQKSPRKLKNLKFSSKFDKNAELQSPPNFRNFSISLRNCLNDEKCKEKMRIDPVRDFPCNRFTHPNDAKPLLDNLRMIQGGSLNYTEIAVDSFLFTRRCSIWHSFAAFLIEASSVINSLGFYERLCYLLVLFCKACDKEGFLIISNSIQSFNISGQPLVEENFCENNSMAFVFEISNFFMNSFIRNYQEHVPCDDYKFGFLDPNQLSFNKICLLLQEIGNWMRENEFSLSVLKVKI